MRLSALTAMMALAVALSIAAMSPVSATASSSTLTRALDQLLKLPTATRSFALAAEVSQEGHWTFANAQGERFTSASAEELRRVIPNLLRSAPTAGARLILVVTEDTVFRHTQHFSKLTFGPDYPLDARIAVETESYPLHRHSERMFASVRPALLVELTDRRLFDEAIWQLDHPMRNAAIRILAVEPGGPAAIAPSPKLDPQTRRPMTDAVAPADVVSSLRSLRGQTVILTARRDGDLLAFRPSSGAEVTLKASDVLAAADAADVNLIVLQSPTPRQPGSRSWMWQRVSVPRLSDAVTSTHLADFLSALAPAETRFLITAREERPGRVGLSAAPLKDGGSGFSDTLTTITSSITGQVVVTGLDASMRDRSRQTELDRRIVPGIPAIFQWSYAALLLLGLAGHRTARSWWARVWPAEHADAYTGRLGYRLAEGARGLAYGLMFLPLAAPLSAPATLLALLRPRSTAPA